MARLTMLLAFAPGAPNGALDDRIELRVPLTPQGTLDEAAEATGWEGQRQLADGHTVPLALLRAGECWTLQPDGQGDDPVWIFEGRLFRPGEYVTLRDAGSAETVYRIVSVTAD